MLALKSEAIKADPVIVFTARGGTIIFPQGVELTSYPAELMN